MYQLQIVDSVFPPLLSRHVPVFIQPGAPMLWACYGVHHALCHMQGACTEDTIAALPQLKLEQLWKPSRSGFDTDVTLVTQLSLER